MKPMSNRQRRLGLILLATLCLPSMGCLAAGLCVAGAAAAGAGTYAYMSARRIQDYPVGYQETVLATRAALTDLGFPLLEQKLDETPGTIVSSTGNNTRITIDLTTTTSPIPTDGATTRVGVRVGLAGDDSVSERILDEINLRIAPSARGPRPGATPGAIQPVAADLPWRPTQPVATSIPVREIDTRARPLQPVPAGNWRGTGP